MNAHLVLSPLNGLTQHTFRYTGKLIGGLGGDERHAGVRFAVPRKYIKAIAYSANDSDQLMQLLYCSWHLQLFLGSSEAY